MYTMILCAIIGLSIALWQIRNVDEVVDRIGLSVICTMCGAVIGLIIATIIGISMPTTWVKSYEVSLASIRTSDSANGHFFLGSGSFQGHTYYAYNILDDDGGTEARTIQADTGFVDVKYDAPEGAGKLVVYQRMVANPSRWILPPDSAEFVEFHVPKGSLHAEFSIR